MDTDHPDDWAMATTLAHAGSHPAEHWGFVNTPVYRGSTVVFPDVDTMAVNGQRYQYGRIRNPSSDALCEAIAGLEQAQGTVLTPSGLSACTFAMLAVLDAGDHFLVPDNVYAPVRDFCDSAARRFGIDTTYYDPLAGAGIEALFRPNTRAVFTEAPGSHTFEVPDIPAIAEVARRRGALVLMDNTWATPLYLKPLLLGVDVSILAATKYVAGHSDALIGAVSANTRAWTRVAAFHKQMGMHVGPDDITLALRGLRTMELRLQRHQSSALAIARWLEAQPQVARVLHPALESHPQHAIWKRDFCGSTGVFSFVTAQAPFEAVKAMLDGLRLFALGRSWGGFESLAMTLDPRVIRSATAWNEPGHLVRLQIGLEDPHDLIADLAAGLARFRAACAPAASSRRRKARQVFRGKVADR